MHMCDILKEGIARDAALGAPPAASGCVDAASCVLVSKCSGLVTGYAQHTATLPKVRCIQLLS
jgi:hypothetical protein